MSFPSPVEYHEWCDKFCLILSATKSPQTHHLQTPQQVSKVTLTLEQSLFLYYLSSLHHCCLVHQVNHRQ